MNATNELLLFVIVLLGLILGTLLGIAQTLRWIYQDMRKR